MLTAAQAGNWDIVKWLATQPGVTLQGVLLIAAQMNNWQIVKLLSALPNIHINKDECEKVLLIAAEKREWEIVQSLGTHPNINLNIKNGQGDTVLLIAAKQGNLAMLSWLTEHPNINLHEKNFSGDTVFSVAQTEAIQAMVDLLKPLQPAAVIHIAPSSITPLYHAQPKTTQSLNPFEQYEIYEKNRAESGLWKAVKAKDWEQVKQLLPSSLRLSDSDNGQILWSAAQDRRWEVIALLLTLEPPLSIDIRSVEDVCMLTSRLQKWESVRLLIERFGNTLSAETAETILLLAAKLKQWDVVKLLSEKSTANLQATDTIGETVFTLAQQANRQDILDFLERQQKQKIKP